MVMGMAVRMRMMVRMMMIMLVVVTVVMVVGVAVGMGMIVMVMRMAMMRIAQGNLLSAIEVNNLRLTGSRAATGCAHSEQLQILDFELFSRKPFEEGVATFATTKRLFECQLVSTFKALSEAWNFPNFQFRPFQCCSFGAQPKTEVKSVWKHGS